MKSSKTESTILPRLPLHLVVPTSPSAPFPKTPRFGPTEEVMAKPPHGDGKRLPGLSKGALL